MHVLVIPYNFPSKSRPSTAIFVQDQVCALRRFIPKVGVLGVIPKTFSMCFRSRDFSFGSVDSEKWVVQCPALRGFNWFNNKVAIFVARKIFCRYLIVNGKPDVVHVHNVQAAPLAVWIKKTYGIPFVITEHSSAMWEVVGNEAIIVKLKRFYLESSANIAVSDALAQHLQNSLGLPFIYIPNLVDVDFFSVNRILKNDGCVQFITVGNLTKNKNHISLVRAVHKLICNGYSVSLKIVGAGEEEHNLRNYIRAHRLDSAIQLLGMVSKQKIRNLFRRSDFFILPSQKETFGVVLIEAMASGLPVLAYKCGGPESIVTNDAVGLLLNQNDDLCEGLLKLINSSFTPTTIMEFVRENFSYEAVVKKLVTVYLAAIK